MSVYYVARGSGHGRVRGYTRADVLLFIFSRHAIPRCTSGERASSAHSRIAAVFLSRYRFGPRIVVILC